jgi:hypothetical protein
VEASAGQLVTWAAQWPERIWAVEGADGLGKLLAEQLVAAGKRVLDVPPKLAFRVRLLKAGDTNKNDPNDGFHNRRRRHSALGWQTPMEFKTTATSRAPAPQTAVQQTRS